MNESIKAVFRDCDYPVERFAASPPREWTPGSATPTDLSWHERRLQAFAKWTGVKPLNRAVGLFLYYGPECGGALRDAFAASYSDDNPPLHEVLVALADVSDWARKEGAIRWSLKELPPDKTSLSCSVPRALGKAFKAAALQAGETVPDFLVSVVKDRVAQLTQPQTKKEKAS